MQRHSKIEIKKDRVIKTAAPELIRVEIEKTKRAYKIAENCGLFRVPKVLEFDEHNGVAVFELLQMRPVRKGVPWGDPWLDFARHMGTLLAIIHRELVLPEEMRIPLPPEFAYPSDEVFLHGDLSVNNICVGKNWPPIIVIDWQMTPLYGGKATYGTRYYDILWFIHNIINNPSFKYILNNSVQTIINTFMQFYFYEAGLKYNTDNFLNYSIRFFDIEMARLEKQEIKKEFSKRRLLFTQSKKILKKFLESIKTFKESDKFIFQSAVQHDEAVIKDYRMSHLHPEKGAAYHAAFFENPYRRMVWKLEKIILDNIVTKFYKNMQINHLDFACGTGRILNHLERHTNSSTGVDLSPSMLDVARKNIKRSKIIEADITKEDILGNKKFNLITAFRFFPNAQKQLRIDAMMVLVKHLEENGYLVFNNHMNTDCLKYRISRLLGRGGYKGMSVDEVKLLAAEARLEIVKTYHLCVFPSTESRTLLPQYFLLRIEKVLARIPMLTYCGENIVFVCRRISYNKKIIL